MSSRIHSSCPYSSLTYSNSGEQMPQDGTDAARDLPDYAKPQRWMVLSEQEFRGLDLLTPNSRPRRSAIHRLVRRSNGSFYPQLGKEERCLPI